MLRKIDGKKLSLRALLFFALAMMLAGCAIPGGIIDYAPSFHTQVAGVASASQLITKLEDSGFSDIRVTPNLPNGQDRRPELMYAFNSAADDDAQVTPVHFGWNGTAVKDGRTVDIYVDRAPRVR